MFWIKGFKTKLQAQKVAELVIKKINMGQLPPIITENELKNIGIK